MAIGSSEWAGPERKLSDFVYDGIFEMIVSGVFPENARLPSEAELSQRFEASRPVIREALARLRDDGIVQSRQGSGSYVRRRPDKAVLRFVEIGSVSDIQRCYDFRIGFESAAAALAARRWTPDTLAELKAALADLDHCIETGQLGVEADARFHRAVALATANPYYISVQASLDANMTVGMNLARNLSLLRPAIRLRIVQDEHVTILNAIEARDEEGARLAMIEHIERARERVFEGRPAVAARPETEEHT